MKTKLVIFGITGDLSTRKLLPALEHIIAEDKDEDLSVIGVSRREVDIPELLKSSIGHATSADRFSMFTMDLGDRAAYGRLKEFIDLQDDEQLVIYLSVPPSASADIVDFLGEAGLNTQNVKLLFEKPFGFDLLTAQDYLQRTARYYDESQIYRIDHYAAKEIAQEIITLRRDARNRHHSWDMSMVASVDVVASEAIGVEDRAIFYEETGALRDFIQGHLMQLLSLVVMNAPEGFDTNDLAKYRLAALEKLNPADPAKAVRAQYEGYQAAVGNVGSLTETFASLVLTSHDENWLGVPFRLTTGKLLDEKRSYITIHYKDGTSEVFEEGKQQPTDGRLLDAYERVLIEAIEGRKTIFTTGPEVIRAWELVDLVQQAWEMDNEPLPLYTPHSTIQEVLNVE